MDRVPPRLPNTASRLIAMAVSLVGPARVMAEMKCSADDFEKYRDGEKEPTWPELDRLVLLVVDQQRIIIARNRDLLARTRAKREMPDVRNKLVTKEEPSRYLTNAEFLKLTPKERVDYLKRVTDEIFYRAQHAGQAK
jgi:hypothetical protein